MTLPCRTAGKTKRDNLDENEDLLLMKTLRDMNLSKLIAQDVPLFLSLLGDLFPAVVAGASGDAHAEVFLVVFDGGSGCFLVCCSGWYASLWEADKAANI